MAAARKTLYITGPYFLPDEDLLEDLRQAARRGVRVVLLGPGPADANLVRGLTRRRLAGLLRDGVEVYEYLPARLHTKSIVVDGSWATLGSANLDNRSFALNAELNLALADGELAGGSRRRSPGTSRTRAASTRRAGRPAACRLASGSGWPCRWSVCCEDARYPTCTLACTIPAKELAMIQLGYKLCSEEHGPADLVRFAQRAEAFGFTFAMISDHFHPWIDRQGQSPFVWSVLGGIAQATERLRVGTAVTCPTIRIHPAILAQAAATTAAMMPGRFLFGLGTGENLNEHILGDRWPPHSVRGEMLEEAVEAMRLLWQGGLRSIAGATTRWRTRGSIPCRRPPPILVAASGPDRRPWRAGSATASSAPLRTPS